jgi:hypothetical protein
LRKDIKYSEGFGYRIVSHKKLSNLLINMEMVNRWRKEYFDEDIKVITFSLRFPCIAFDNGIMITRKIQPSTCKYRIYYSTSKIIAYVQIKASDVVRILPSKNIVIRDNNIKHIIDICGNVTTIKLK